MVVLQPNKPGCVTESVLEDLPLPILEYFFDTTRTVTNMILKGTLKHFPDIKFVIPHAGAFLSVFADRLAGAIKLSPSLFRNYTEREIDVYAALKGFYYDVAGACLPVQLSALLQIAEVDHLLYGSDYSYTPEVGCIALADANEGRFKETKMPGGNDVFSKVNDFSYNNFFPKAYTKYETNKRKKII